MNNPANSKRKCCIEWETTISKVAQNILFQVLWAIIGSILSWFVFVKMFSPQEDDILNRAASLYFKNASDAKMTKDVSFTDCAVLHPDIPDKRNGVAFAAKCASKNPDGPILFVNFTETGNVLYSEFYLHQNDPK